MLAVTANWLLSDGSLLPPRTAAAGGWLASFRRAALRAGWEPDGRYRPVDAACLVMAGDTFDLLVSDAWTGRDRPWHGGGRARTARAAVLARCLRAARSPLRPLCRWSRRGLPVPMADARGRPSFRTLRPVPLSVFLLAGDRDGWLGEAGPAAARFGIATGEEWTDGEVLIRHGHDLDPLCRPLKAAGERPPTLAESIAIDLVVPFAVAARSDPLIWPAIRAGLAELAVARPAGIPRWIARLTATCPAAGRPGSRLATVWRRSVDGWRAAARRDPPACEAEFDIVDGLAAWFTETGVADPLRPSAAAAAAADLSPASRPAASPPGRTAAPPDPFVIAAHGSPAGDDGPRLAVVRRGGAGWGERLGPPPARPRVVTIGFDAAGSSVVDAA